jgi:putative spermidine/putrescine transport system permease protein
VGRPRRIDPIAIALYLFLIGVGIFILTPLVFVIVNSFNASADSIFPPSAYSLRWYETVLRVEPFRKGMVNSLIVATGSTLFSLVIGALVARALTRHSFRGKSFFRTLFLSPLVVPRIVLGFSLFLLFIRIGLNGTQLGMIAGHALLGLPFVTIILTASMLAVDRETEEAAADLGANAFQTFVFITLPQMRVGLVVAALFAFITSFDEVEVSIFLTRPAINTLPVEMFIYAEQFQDPTLAAVSALLILLSTLFVVVGILVLRTQDYRRLIERG